MLRVNAPIAAVTWGWRDTVPIAARCWPPGRLAAGCKTAGWCWPWRGSFFCWWLAATAVLLGGALAIVLMPPAARLVARWVSGKELRRLSAGTLALVAALVFAFGRWGGLAVLMVAAGIRLIPPFWRSRRLNCLGVLLFSLTLNLLGWGAPLAGWLGLT